MKFLILFLLFVVEECKRDKERERYYKERKNYFQNCPRHVKAIYGQRTLKTIKYLFPKDVDGKDLVRVGYPSTCAYIMLDQFSNVSCAYSFGIEESWSWDVEMAAKGIFVYMFDPYYTKAGKSPEILNNTLLKFYDYGIRGETTQEGLNDPEFERNEKLMTINEILKMDNNMDKTNMILKMDIEGWEWDFLASVSSSVLEKFSQILIEFHWFDKMIKSTEKFSVLLKSFENLNKTHQLVWLNGHNGVDYCVLGGVPIPLAIEAAYVRRDKKLIFKDYDKKKKRFDARNDHSRGKLLLWWFEDGEEVYSDQFSGSFEQKVVNKSIQDL